MADKTYEEIRSDVISKFSVLYKDALAMDICEVPKETRIRLLADPVYISKTKALRAGLFKESLDILNNVLGGTYAPDTSKDQSGTILKALEMRNNILLEDLNVTKDDSNALNVAFTAMSREDFESLSTVEINEGSNSNELGADFGGSEDTDSFESRVKARTQEKLKELEEKNNVSAS